MSVPNEDVVDVPERVRLYSEMQYALSMMELLSLPTDEETDLPEEIYMEER